MIIYKMFKHEPMNNPALGEKPDWFIMFRAKKDIFQFLFCKKRDDSLVLLFHPPRVKSGDFYRSRIVFDGKSGKFGHATPLCQVINVHI